LGELVSPLKKIDFVSEEFKEYFFRDLKKKIEIICVYLLSIKIYLKKMSVLTCTCVISFLLKK